MKYKKYFRKTSLKQEGVGEFFLKEIAIKKPKTFLEVGVFHGVTARNVCELLYSIHGKEFKYIGLDLFEENNENIGFLIKKFPIERSGNKIILTYDYKKQKNYASEFLSELTKRSFKFIDIETEKSNLEEIFINLVKK